MEFQIVTNKCGSVYKCLVCRDNEICIIETSVLKQRAIDKALDRLYIKLRCQGINPNSVKLTKIDKD